ncbi:putative mfs lactose protein [Botrytis fragariae]|uniref:Putative mfs lactose protein n=1 Tax=Botrytis fragariae TaxID=1964551 RepID=A0A8H6AXZ7_9HELO|nr:putative mfs lactose protein [Botrytis fragariae]KAF5875858.1 putative mfs lactose protein [Botrytis fragariae]
MAKPVPSDTELDAWKASPNADTSVHDEQQHQHEREEPSTKIKTVQNIALADATAKQKPSLWTWRMSQLYVILFLATLNAAVNGYDGSVMSSINSYAQYRSYFGFDLTEGTPATGIVYAMFTIGNLWKGRRWGMFLGAGVIIVGAIVQATSQNLAAFMIGRFMLGVGAAMGPSSALPYVSEMAHPSFRGAMTGVYTTFYFVGAIPGTFIPYATSYINGSQAWRIPLWLQMTFSGIVFISVLFLPESPRWLVANDRHEEALDIMARYHGEGDRSSPLVQLELREMMEEISKTGADKRWWDFRELFDTREVRYRTMLTCAVALFGQWTGNGPVSYYYPQMLAGAGIENNHTQLLLQGMQSVLSFISALIGAAYTDHWGRRPQLLISTSLISLLFLIILILNALNTTTDSETHLTVAKSAAASNAEIAMIFLFSFVFAVGWTPMQGLYAVEVLRYESRAKGMAVYTLVGNVAGFYNTFVTGIAFSGAGWRYYYLFIFWDLLEVVFIYFFFVETKGRTLEELTEIFNAAKPVKYSLKKSEVVIHGDEGVTEVLEKKLENESLG